MTLISFSFIGLSGGHDAGVKRIVRARSDYPTQHRHVTAVGVLDDVETIEMPIELVRKAMRHGESFLAEGPDGRTSVVEEFDCWCGFATIRSTMAMTLASDVEHLPPL